VGKKTHENESEILLTGIQDFSSHLRHMFSITKAVGAQAFKLLIWLMVFIPDQSENETGQ